jgi:hypothetical protein
MVIDIGRVGIIYFQRCNFKDSNYFQSFAAGFAPFESLIASLLMHGVAACRPKGPGTGFQEIIASPWKTFLQ